MNSFYANERFILIDKATSDIKLFMNEPEIARTFASFTTSDDTLTLLRMHEQNFQLTPSLLDALRKLTDHIVHQAVAAQLTSRRT